MVLFVVALIIAALGVVGAIIPVIPGLVLSSIALFMGYLPDYSTITLSELAIWVGVSVVVSVMDYFLPVYLIKRLGGSKSGVWGATIGLIVGFIAFPPLGIILCPLLGAVMGELINDKEDINRAIKVGMASLLAFIVSTGAKFAVALYILSIIIGSQSGQIDQIIEQIKALF